MPDATTRGGVQALVERRAMQRQTIGREVERPVGLDLDARFRGKYISLTSFKRDGAGVATPVWFVVEDGQLLVLTDTQSFKAKRIRRNPRVMVAPCSAGGRLRSDPVSARAEILPPSELHRVDQLMTRKYRLDRIVVLPIYRAVRRLRGFRDGTGNVILAITPTSQRKEPL